MRKQRGFVIVLVLGGVMVVALLGVLMMHLYNRGKVNDAATKGAFIGTQIITEIKNQVSDKATWAAMRYNNANLTCLRGIAGGDCTAQGSNGPPAGTYPATTTGTLVLYNRDGTTYYDSTSATSGFDMTGAVCANFNSAAGSGNNKCPFHAVIYWVPTCTPTLASAPCNSLKVCAYLVYNAATNSVFTHAFNPANYSFCVYKNYADTSYQCCSIGCMHTTGDSGLAYVTRSVLKPSSGNSTNCYAGSPEIPNDICTQVFSTSPASNDWVPAGTANNSIVSTTQCKQGLP
jgi:hypothetical protein